MKSSAFRCTSRRSSPASSARRRAPRVAVDAVFDSVSVATTFKEELAKAGVIFMPISEALREASRTGARNISARWCRSRTISSPRSIRRCSPTARSSTCRAGVRCPMELSTYFRINEKNTGQFERTLIIADKGSYVSYLEGCTAPQRDENQLHAAVVELVALDDAEIKYSTVQNWYPGDTEGRGGIYNFVTKRGDCRGRQCKDFLDPGRDRLGHHLEISELHPARRPLARRILFHRDLQRPPAGRFRHQDDPSRQEHDEPDHFQGHLRRASRRTPIAAWCRPIAEADRRPQLHQLRFAADRRHTAARIRCPISRRRTRPRMVEHEATTSKISEDTLFYCMQRGLSQEEAVALVVNGFVPRRAAAIADGIRRRGAKADLDQP